MYFTQSLHRALQQHPERIACIYAGRERTFAEFADRVARLAGGLRRLGVQSGDRVAMLALNSDRYLEYLAAVPWADGVLVPVNTRWSVAEIGHALRDCDAQVLLIGDEFLSILPELQASVPGIRRTIHVGDENSGDVIDYEELVAGSDPAPDARRGGDALAALFYTGGTTGVAKGVMLSHANLTVSALGCAAVGYWVTPGGRYLHSAPMFHLADLCLWMAHSLAGNTHVIVPKFEPADVLTAVSGHQVTDLFLVPAMIQMLVDHPGVADYDLSSVRRFCYGASPISEAVLQRTMHLLPDVELAQAYGMTELSPVATLLGPDDHRGVAARLRSAGRAAPHSEVRIVDEVDNEVPPGAVGEIVCRGGHVMLGYWKQPAATAAAVRDGWMHTGDGGYMDEDGYLYVVDRIKDMIVSGGENVYSAEVENALSQHPAVAACAVIGVPDPTYGERVHAVVVTAPGADVTAEALRAHTKGLIAGYKAPRSFEFMDALPQSGAGKVLKRELRRRHWEAAPRDVS
jgi:acyl-CoA synthetase (AMP-forming)/AMP-acid ligase II